MPVRHVTPLVALLLAGLAAAPARAQTSTSNDARVQAPALKAPERGSLAGPLASFGLGPADVTRGAYHFAAPFALPEERGAAGVSPFPAYSPEAGLSEWGIGWGASLSLTRFRLLGPLDYATDQLLGPWGRMVRGTDGAWYAAGLSAPVRMTEGPGDTFEAVLSDGARWTFGGAARTPGAQGTFAWHLTAVTTVDGRRTLLDWEANASGRYFLKSLRYAEVAGAFQYQADFEYTPLARPFRDARSGAAVLLDRRVSAVVARARNAATGALEERWRFELGYLDEGLGPAYYLASVTQRYASGQALPPATYTYALAKDRLKAAALKRASLLDRVLAAEGSAGTQPDRASLADVDEDGQLDVEMADDNLLWRQTPQGFVSEPLPAFATGTPVECRRPASSLNAPRTLAAMRASDREPVVVGLKTQNSGTETLLTLCTRPGVVLHQQVLPLGNWTPSANVRLADLDRDLAPDLVRVASGRYTVMRNTSTSAGYGFAPPREGTLTPAFLPTATWVHDLNGDGLPDLVARSSSNVVAWLGRGDGTFLAAGELFDVRSGNTRWTSLGDYQFTFLDANKDGLADLLLTRSTGGAPTLFVNDGEDFVQAQVGGFASITTSYQRPVVADFSGSGNTEVSYASGSYGYAVALDGPSTGLLTDADDGRGSRVHFEYARAPAERGARGRPSVLAVIESVSSGNDTVRATYTFSGAQVHGQARHLVGFRDVQRERPFAVESATFLHGDDVSGLPASSTEHDLRAPAVSTYTYQTYEDATFRGVAFKRLREEGRGFTQEDGQAVGAHTEYLAYPDERCATRVLTTHGVSTLLKELTPAAGTVLPGALHCLYESARLTGSHPEDPSLDFVEETRAVRNERGRVVTYQSVAEGSTFTVQTAAYRTDGQLESLAVAGRGTTQLEYDPQTGQLMRVTAPDGVVTEAALDPRTGAVLRLGTLRGTLATSRSFRYDGLERLERQWDDLGGATEDRPSERLTYRYATATLPAVVRADTLVDAARGVYRAGVEWQTAAGEKVAVATLIPEGWQVDGLTARARGSLEERQLVRDPLAPGADPLALDYAALLAGARELGWQRSSGLGGELDSTRLLHADVVRGLSTRLSVAGGLLRQDVIENGALTRTQLLDAGRHVVAVVDEGGARYDFTYDVAGRLRRVRLPDGKRHAVDFDAHGRPERVARDGVATVTYTYSPTTGRAETKSFWSPGGLAQRSEAYGYDAAGRLVLTRHTDAATGQTRDFRTYYDGATPDAPDRRTTLGLLTAVAGEGFEKRMTYRADGALLQRQLVLTGWREVETTYAYRDDGSVSEERTCVRRTDASVVTCSAFSNATDAFGRPGTVSLNGALMTELSYDGRGLVAAASLPEAGWVTFDHDPLTSDTVGFRRGGGFESSATWRFNARGLIGSEGIGAGGLSLERAYTFSPEGYLATSSDAQATYGYTYDALGLPVSIQEGGVTRDVRPEGDGLRAGTTLYRFDAFGRTVARDDLQLAYGPDGHLSRAQRGARTWEYLYDEAGQRLLKREGGAPVAAYLAGDAYLDEGGLTQPVHVQGYLVGVLVNAAFKPFGADARGSVLTDYDGTLRAGSPYGQREVHPNAAAALDYAQKAWDADLGTVRMGVRDYDPALGRFLTPDPLFLESPDKCLESPAECNLYGYVRSNPVTYTDPTGKQGPLVDYANRCFVGGPCQQVAERGWYYAAAGAALLGAGLGALKDTIWEAMQAGMVGDPYLHLATETAQAQHNYAQVDAHFRAYTEKSSLSKADVRARTEAARKAFNTTGVVPVFLSARDFPEASAHVEEAIFARNKPIILTYSPAGKDARRAASLSGYPSIPGMDRDEYPPAVALEGGANASVKYITPSDNRGAGAIMGAQLRFYKPGTQFMIVIVDRPQSEKK